MHVITGQIRKDVYTKEGSGAKGPWKMYAVELSEMTKEKDGTKTYTNYKAVFFASQNQIQYYDQWIAKGRVISVTCKTLKIDQRESNGKNYITLEMVYPDLAFFEDTRGAQQQNGWGQPQQPTHSGQQQNQPPRQQQQQPQQSDAPPMDFEDDIPF